MRSSDWSSDVCSSDLTGQPFLFGCSCGRQSGWTSFSFPSLPPALSGLSQSRGCLTMVVSLYMRTPGYRPRDWEKRGAGTHVIAIRRERGRRGHAYNGGRGKGPAGDAAAPMDRSEEHTSELQSLMRISYAVFCLKKKINDHTHEQRIHK